MPNMTVSRSGNSLIVDMGDYPHRFNMYSYRPDELSLVAYNDEYVYVYMAETNDEWTLTNDQSYSGDEVFIVDGVDGVAPTSLEDLFNKITALR